MELILEFLYGIYLARGDVPAPVDVAKTAATDELLLLELIPEDGLAFR